MPGLSSPSMDKIKSEWITELNIRSDAVDVCLGDEFGVRCEESRQQRQSGSRLHKNNKIAQQNTTTTYKPEEIFGHNTQNMKEAKTAP